MPGDPAEGTDDAAADALLVGLADDLDGAFADLMRSYERVMYLVALRISGEPAEAEDLVAESFLRAYRALRGYGRARILTLRPRPWLLAIMHNTWRNNLRSTGRRPQHTLVADPPETVAPAPGVEEQIEQHETRQELAALVARLPPSQRVAVVLRHVGDVPIAEIAVIMRIPEGTAKSHVSRGLSKLREMYESRPPGATTLPNPARMPASAAGRGPR